MTDHLSEIRKRREASYWPGDPKGPLLAYHKVPQMLTDLQFLCDELDRLKAELGRKDAEIDRLTRIRDDLSKGG